MPNCKREARPYYVSRTPKCRRLVLTQLISGMTLPDEGANRAPEKPTFVKNQKGILYAICH
jgi:hypothetical protein